MRSPDSHIGLKLANRETEITQLVVFPSVLLIVLLSRLVLLVSLFVLPILARLGDHFVSN